MRMMDKLILCRSIQTTVDLEKEHGQSTYHNNNTPTLSYYAIADGKTMGKAPLQEPLKEIPAAKAYNHNNNNNNNNHNNNNYNNRAGGKENRNYRDRERDRYIQPNNRQRDRSRSRSRDHHRRQQEYDNRRREEVKTPVSICTDQLAFVLKLPGRVACKHKTNCYRDHNFSNPISSRVKDKVVNLLNSDKKYGIDINDTRKKFKEDLLKAMGR
jgi:hypothetical protein